MRNYVLKLTLFITLFSINSINAYSASISSILANINNHSSAKTATIVRCAKGALCPPENISVAEAKR